MDDTQKMKLEIENLRHDVNRLVDRLKFETNRHRKEIRTHMLKLAAMEKAIRSVSPEISKIYADSYVKEIQQRDAMDDQIRKENRESRDGTYEIFP